MEHSVNGYVYYVRVCLAPKHVCTYVRTCVCMHVFVQ